MSITSTTTNASLVRPKYNTTVLQARQAGPPKTVILADVSGSMAAQAWGGGTPYSRLKEALIAVPKDLRFSLIAFNDDAAPVRSVDRLPAPGGGTYFGTAIRRAMMSVPSHIIIITDGKPS